jgi:hypothetical protein
MVVAVAQSSSKARRDQSTLELARLEADVRAWLEHRRARDSRNQYSTQLGAIETFVGGAVSGLRRGLDEGDAGRGADEIYRDCRALDVRVAWLRRVWGFFREKFDQRDDPQLEPVLAAADEVVWSCHRTVLARAELAGIVRRHPAPLPYIEPYYSPEAFPAELVPAGLRSEVDVDFAREHLNRLPIPVVRLTPACVSAPWWLVYLGHEVGHHVQYGLLDDMELVGRFRQGVEQTVIEAGGSAADGERWGRWSREVFADVCSVLFMGPWALWAMVELEFQPLVTMSQRRSSYPAPAIRLLLLRETVTALGLDPTSAARGLDLDDLAVQDPATSTDAGFVPSIVAYSLGPAIGLPQTLRELSGFMAEFRAGGPVSRWSERLCGHDEPIVEKKLRTPRLLVSGAVEAWAGILDGAGAAEREALAQRSITAIGDSGEEGTRAAAAGAVDATELGEELAQLLMARETVLVGQ